MKPLLKKLRRDEEGATAIEYGLLAAIIAIGLVGIWQQIGFDLRPIFSFLAGEIEESKTEAEEESG